ncbi:MULTISPECIES: LacI family DNA-binding transcriptional regulator [unclassified Leucobacter]|uniref:LacI family DNA-binding transcriptional regulator n=1 Tax=unclassified Leucobacter TaxID=2621730 RepID=UPI00165E7B69|nr:MULTISPECIES: LacI family DNA-binding transcriptional regulator [unclassified Leucobacter]MBC9936543.1 LacI family DNA-binding transcriptional regulator [Leucobacter sp. cx-87]
MVNADRTSKRATIRDVAARVGLSTSTVSAALNGGGVLKESTRERVRLAAAELDYRPSRTALAFRLGRTGSIAYSLPVVDEGSVSLLGVEAYMVGARAAASAAFDSGYALTLTPPQLRGDAAWNMLGVDGVVLCDPEFNDERLNTLERLGVPVVTIERDASRPDSPYVVAGDYRGNAVKVLDHLRAEGARTIALLLPDASWSSTEDSRRGYEEWANAHGMEPIIRRVPTDRAHNDAYGATLDLISGSERPDAIFATVEQYRARVFSACRDSGIRVPEDMLIAMGGDSQAAEFGNPSVTAIDQQSALNSELAVQMLLRRINGEEVAGAIVTEGALRVRQSTLREAP